MAFARVQGNNSVEGSGAATTEAVTLGAAVTSGNAVCGLVSWDGAGSVTLNSVTDDKGNTYNLETAILDTVANQRSCAYSRTNITNAPITITANFSASIGYSVILADEFSGGSTASTDERDGAAHTGQTQGGPGTGADAVTSGTVTTSTNGCLIYGAVMTYPSPPTSGTGFSTGISATLADYAVASEYRTQATAGSGTAATFTQGVNSSCTTFLIAIKPAGGGGDALQGAQQCFFM